MTSSYQAGIGVINTAQARHTCKINIKKKLKYKTYKFVFKAPSVAPPPLKVRGCS